ncbi:EamA family transporter [Granulicella arctica]|uniref:Drug/metabolite transporter (DMT)-like permease n=1 Tax=Granulicella arctica TaxID=940613 RepID=A0A7Y9TGG0_9BACT|nr:EamA family transporter [Granulicella arctica]NYF79871.1 drug/metabolite transporter (DMT)-like permease [Granulicella arctica]
MTPASTLETWALIVTVAATAIAGDVLTAGAMRRIGDLDLVRAKSGMLGAIEAVTGSSMFLCGVLSMALSFFSLLFTLSKVDVSLAAPASASLTFIGNAAAAKIFLHENVDRRRWFAAIFVCIGVVLLSR